MPRLQRNAGTLGSAAALSSVPAGTILVIDDDPAVVATISDLLEEQGHRVLGGHCSAEALRMARDTAPDLVLLDAAMPGEDGFAVCRALRGIPHLRNVPIILLTGIDDDEVETKAFAAGGTDLLSKPIRAGNLLARTGHHLTVHAEHGAELLREHALQRSVHDSTAQVRTFQQAVHQRTAQLETLLDTLPDLVFLKDPTGAYLECNRRFEEFLGRRSGQIIGRRDEELFPPAIAAVLQANDHAAIHADGPHRATDWFSDADGRRILLETTTTPVRDDGGRLSGLLGVARDVTDRHHTEQQLRDSRDQLLEAQRVAGFGSWSYDVVADRVTGSEVAVQILGFDPGTTADIAWFRAIVYPADLTILEAAWDEARTSGTFHAELRVLDGERTRWIQLEAEVERDADGQPRQVLGTVLDVTRTRAHDQQLEEERARLADALDAAQAATWEWDVVGDEVVVSDRWLTLLGHDADHTTPPTLTDWATWLHPSDASEVLDSLARLIRGETDRHEVEYRIRHAEGHWVTCRDVARVAERDRTGHARLLRGMVLDITGSRRHQEQLDFVATHDGLTGLSNRRRFAEHLQDELASVRRSDTGLALVCFDLDDFEGINLAHGRAGGNQLLIEIAGRLLNHVGVRTRVARLGGDEFAVILVGLHDAAGWRERVEEVYDLVTRPVTLQGRPLQTTASIGVTVVPQARDVDAEQLLRQADQAVYHAKLAGKDRHHRFDPVSHASRRERFELFDRVHTGLSEDQFVLHYQPQVNLRTGEILGFEALIRWDHPEDGLIAPKGFIPALVGHPLSIEVGDWVIERALRQLETWSVAGLDTKVSVNIDTAQLYDPSFGARLAGQIAACPSVRPDQLTIEILETGALDDLEHVSALLWDVRDLGVGAALDDFGTGHSSLTLLKRLAAGLIKIDGSFVMEVLADPEQALIIDSIVTLTRNFQRQVMAEGVESEAHGRLLIQLGCDLGQGFGIAHPMPADEVLDWIARWRSPTSWQETVPLPEDRVHGLLAELEHRAWCGRLSDHLSGGTGGPPTMDERRCRLGRWIQVQQDRGGGDWLEAIARPHTELHKVAARLLDAQSHGAESPDPQDLAQLERFTATLIEALQHWQRAEPQRR